MLHEVSRGLPNCSWGRDLVHQGEVCRGELRLSTRNLFLFLCNGPEGCNCFCGGHRAAEDFKLQECHTVTNVTKCDMVKVCMKNIAKLTSPSQ